MPSQKKKTYVEELSNFLTEAKHFALIKFENTTHTTLEKLRKELKKDEAVFKVVKNTLFEKAIERLAKKQKSFKDLQENALPLQENSAVLILGENYHKGLSAFFRFAKAEKTLSFKFGILEAKLQTGDVLNQIAQLPSKEDLIAKLLGSMKAPSTRLVYSMKFGVSKLVYVLGQRAKQAS